MSRMPDQYAFAGPYQEAEPGYYSDSDFGYPLEYEVKPVAPAVPVNQVVPSTVSRTIEPQPASRKRKASLSLDYLPSQPQKKVALAQVHVQDPEGEYYELNQPSPYSPYISGPQVHTANNSPRPSHHYSTSNASQISLAAPSPHTPAWSPSFTTVKTEHSPRAPMTPIARPASTSTPYSSGAPKLVRTSTIPQQSSPNVSAGTTVNVNPHAFNPYAMYPQSKASLRLNGDLDAVATEWSEEELEARRKLIVFTRSQVGSVIEAEFKAVSQENWTRSDITVNCIWWKEKKEAFVTSVDTIALLEQLVAVRFTVEEKNRIRRNLEGFRPLTVSKAKTDSEDFFKVIMGFPNPKPRNIEKDVKVFPWKILAPALKKIISKYSASYSSTASTLVTPAASVYASTEHSSDYQLVPSPRHDMMAHSMPSCNLPVTSYEPHLAQSRMSAPVSSAVVGLALQVPSMPTSYEMMQHYGYEMMPIPPYTMHAPQQAMTAPVHRPQPMWNFDAYLPSEMPGQMQAASAPASAYPHGHSDTADFNIPPAYQQHYHH